MQRRPLIAAFSFLLLHFYEFDLEIQLFSCHLMVRIEGDRRLILCCYLDREWLAILIGQVNLLTDSQDPRSPEAVRFQV